MLPDPVAQSLFNHSQAACCRCLALARLNKPRRLLLEFKRVPAPLPIPHLRYPFALEQLAKEYVLRGQGHKAAKKILLTQPLPPLHDPNTLSLASHPHVLLSECRSDKQHPKENPQVARYRSPPGLLLQNFKDSIGLNR